MEKPGETQGFVRFVQGPAEAELEPGEVRHWVGPGEAFLSLVSYLKQASYNNGHARSRNRLH